jgi:hypothetical protein
MWITCVFSFRSGMDISHYTRLHYVIVIGDFPLSNHALYDVLSHIHDLNNLTNVARSEMKSVLNGIVCFGIFKSFVL